jgi:hypothetical protein
VRRRRESRRALQALGAGLLLVVRPAALASGTSGVIRATLDPATPVVAVLALERNYTDVGVYSRPHPGRIENGRVEVPGLTVPGRYDLRFDFANGYVEGWDSTVPESDYVEEQPLAPESAEAVVRKMASDQFTAFGDEAVILDMQGNVQNVVLLMMQVRRQPFVGGGYRAGEWVWRVDRWRWENPEERTWVPYQERPYYSLVRERLYEKDYAAKRVVYARHLGGIVLDAGHPAADLGAVRVPTPPAGVHAAQPDGTTIEWIRLKPLAQKEGGTR